MEIDPLDWTVDQVVAFLCHSPSTPWLQSANPLQRPDPVSFEAALRENLVNGEVLLNDVEGVSLREDLGLKAFGHRSMVLAAIRYLRQLSVKYQKTAIIQGKLFLLVCTISSLAGIRSWHHIAFLPVFSVANCYPVGL